MKTMTDIYNDLKAKFFNKTNLDIRSNGGLDSVFYATADGIKQAYNEIEANKNPHLWTNLDSAGLISTGYMVNLPKESNESDSSYNFRIMNWTKINEASNSTAIEAALINIDYVSNATYVPLTDGAGTATVYIIPTDLAYSDQAIQAVKNKLSKVISPSSYINYVIPTILPIKLILYISAPNGDIAQIKNNILLKIQKYINNIAPGDYLDIGAINKIGVNEANVDYFRLAEIYINEVQCTDLQVLQKINSKFLLQDDGIVWWMAVNQ